MSEELVKDATDETTEHLGLIVVSRHHHRQTETAKETIVKIRCTFDSSINLPRHQDLAAWNERNVGPTTENAPERFHSSWQDIHGQLAATLLLLDEQGQTCHEA